MSIDYSYPSKREPGADTVHFSHIKYRANYAQRQIGLPPADGATISLYMPTDIPADTITNAWNAEKDRFSGPVGKAKMTAIANVLNGSLNIETSDAKAYGTEFMARGAAQLAGTSKNEILGLSQGRIFNPNIEMLYDGLGLRNFSFNFNFVSTNSTETQRVSNIIKEFKMYSSPDIDSDFMEVPHLWIIGYAGKAARYLNSFKPCILKSVSVKNNEKVNLHMTYESGEPINTSLALNFVETQLVSRKDHESRLRGF